MRRLTIIAALVLAGCGSGGGEPRATATEDAGSPTAIESPAPPGTDEGRRVAAQSGCLACHLLGRDGNDGPGPELTKVGARLSRERLRTALVDAKAPMPSYEGLPRDKLDALVDYLAALR